MALYGDPAREQALDARDPAIEATMKRQEEEIHTVFPESPTRSSEPGSASGTANRLPVTLEVIGTPATPEPPRRRHADPTPKKREIMKEAEAESRVEQERTRLIRELVDADQYDRWVAMGSYFGQSGGLISSELIPIPYKDMHGDIVYVQLVDDEFHRWANNIPVFEYVHVEDPSTVCQGRFRIVDENEPLSTSGLTSCTGVAMKIGSKKFMTHLDASTTIEEMVTALRQVMAKEKKKPTDVNIYNGTVRSEMTLERARQLCDAVGIPPESQHTQSVQFFEKVRI